MKKLAARDFEDILQVCLHFYFYIRLANIPSSVLFRYLKGCSPLTTMRLCSLCYINLHSGMHSPSSESTRSLPWVFSKKHSRNSPGSCGSFGSTSALLLTPWSYQKRKQPVKESPPSALKPTMPLPSQVERRLKSLI